MEVIRHHVELPVAEKPKASSRIQATDLRPISQQFLRQFILSPMNSSNNVIGYVVSIKFVAWRMLLLSTIVLHMRVRVTAISHQGRMLNSFLSYTTRFILVT
jgi:hypothetical protein